MAYKDIPVADLLLDSRNPRLVSTEGQADLIKSLLGKKPRELLNLAKDIVAQSGLSPIDIPYVIHHRGKLYVVVEGNRRTAALKILANPDLAKGSAVHAEFRRLAGTATLPKKVFCAVASDRDEAAHWIELRHTGPNEGAGVVRWNAVMRERFKASPGSQANKALVLSDELSAAYAEDEEMLELIDDVRDNQLTLLGRLAADPDVRKRLGLVYQGNAVAAHYSADDLRPVLKRIFTDIAEKIVTSRSLNGKKERADYLTEISDELPDQTKRSPDAAPLEPSTETTTAPTKPKRKPRKKKPLLFPDLTLDRFPSRLTEILHELNRLNLDQFPNSGAVLMRVLIELALTEYYAEKGWQWQDLKTAVRKCANDVDPSQKAAELEGVRVSLTVSNHFMAVKTIQRYLHNLQVHPPVSDLRAIAANYQYLLQELNNRMPAK